MILWPLVMVITDPDAVQAAFLHHLDRCNTCNYNQHCMVCELGADVDDRPEYHACWCKRSGKEGMALFQLYAFVRPVFRARFEAERSRDG